MGNILWSHEDKSIHLIITLMGELLRVTDLVKRKTLHLEENQVETIEDNAETGCQLLANQLGKVVLLRICCKPCDHVQKTSLAHLYYPVGSIHKAIADIQVDIMINDVLSGTPEKKCTLCILKKNMLRK